ncbi:MAG: hypothetical protein ACSW8J_03245 [bacterium]
MKVLGKEGAALMETSLRLPENAAVRLIDLSPSVGGLISVDETGFVNIYINARLSRDGQLEALRHELRHYYRDDLYSGADIRDVERLAEKPDVLRGATKDLHSGNRARAAELNRVRALLLDACHICEVAQRAPAVPVSIFMSLASGLNVGDISPIAPPSAVLRFDREEVGRLHGALYFDHRGRLNNALAVFEAMDQRVTVDLRAHAGRLDICAITAEAEGRALKIY